MNKRGFTLVELLGVIVILSIIMLIAIPNVTAVLERTKKDNYIVDCKRFVSMVQTELRNGRVEKPILGEEEKIDLKYFENTGELQNDSDGYEYDMFQSFVNVKNEDGFLVYYVQLVAKNYKGNNHYRGIKLVDIEKLDGDDRYQYYKNDFEI